ncbi:MAG: hypothetical protein EBU23_14040 [Mycobacteriaceae bacterium]|nr:hypothetical protein [Mycobacteriaceae bacterium]
MTDPETIAVPDEAEISLLDLLQVIADNLRLLLGGSLLAGLVGLVGLRTARQWDRARYGRTDEQLPPGKVHSTQG